MKQVTKKTFKSYAKDTEKSLNTLRIKATTVFTDYGVIFSLYRDERNVGYVTVWHDGYTSGTDETTGEKFRIPPFQPTMKSLFKAVYETVNSMLKENCFKFDWKYFAVTFKMGDVFCANIAYAARKSEVEIHYSKYDVCEIREADECEVEMAKRKHMPIIKIA